MRHVQWPGAGLLLSRAGSRQWNSFLIMSWKLLCDFHLLVSVTLTGKCNPSPKSASSLPQFSPSGCTSLVMFLPAGLQIPHSPLPPFLWTCPALSTVLRVCVPETSPTDGRADPVSSPESCFMMASHSQLKRVQVPFVCPLQWSRRD